MLPEISATSTRFSYLEPELISLKNLFTLVDCVYVSHVRKSGGNLEELFLFPPCGFQDGTWFVSHGSKHPYPLYCLAGRGGGTSSCCLPQASNMNSGCYVVRDHAQGGHSSNARPLIFMWCRHLQGTYKMLGTSKETKTGFGPKIL